MSEKERKAELVREIDDYDTQMAEVIAFAKHVADEKLSELNKFVNDVVKLMGSIVWEALYNKYSDVEARKEEDLFIRDGKIYSRGKR